MATHTGVSLACKRILGKDKAKDALANNSMIVVVEMACAVIVRDHLQGAEVEVIRDFLNMVKEG